VVKSVTPSGIIIRGDDGTEEEVQLYNNYPLNDAKSVLHSTPLVKQGQKVREGSIIADSNFSKGGTLALGTNLRVAYTPYKGYNFEDGVVVSDAAAQKMRSVHLYKKNVPVDADTVTDKIKYKHEHHGVFKTDQLAKVGDDGIVRVGQRVDPGDPLVLAMRKFQIRDRTGLGAIRKSLGGHHTDRSLKWDGDLPGEVVSVHRRGKDVNVHIRTLEPMQIGDKLVGRYGNKGIVTRIIPKEKMPRTKDGKPIEVALNPSGVPGRMNVGQVLETAVSKIAEKTGKPYVVQNFDPNVDQLARVKKELKSHGLSDTEELFDPITNQPMGKALVGKQHMLKLHHQIDKKVSARAGMTLPGASDAEKYDLNLQPTGGGHQGGQAMDPLGLYALLAHGAKANIREMMTWKSEGPDPQSNPAKRWSSQHNDVWDAIQHGDPLPTPKPTFAFHKFSEMLKGAGINIEKKGHDMVLTPMTDKQIVELSGNRVLTKPAEMLYARIDPKTGDPKPKPGGLFDEKLTGGHGGKKWSRIELAEPIPNPVFETPIRHLTGLTDKEYNGVVGGELAVDKKGNVVELGKGATGGPGIKRRLDLIDVNKDLETAKRVLQKAPASKVDKTLKKVKYLTALKQADMKPSEAYVLSSIPVMPPALRPVTVMQDGNFKFADINQLYSYLAQSNLQLKDPELQAALPEEERKELRKNIYDGMKAITGAGVPYKDAKHKGLIHQIHGAQPKSGFFQGTLINRKQDMTMRSTIVPEPGLELDEVGLPREHAMKLMSPMVVRELRWMGAAKNTIEAQKQVKSGSSMANKALDRVAEKTPVLLKRDPALHKYSVQAFKPKIVAGNAIQIHPLVTGGYNADFDGDTMSVFVPITEEAKKEAYGMMPSNNLFSEATGKLVYQPTLESALGLYKTSEVNTGPVRKKFKQPLEAVDSVRNGKIKINDPVMVGSQKTTVGRVLMSAALPEPLQDQMLTDLAFRMDKDGLDQVLGKVARDHKGEFGDVANKMKNIGNGAASGVVPVEHRNYVGPNRLNSKDAMWVPMGTHTLALDDFTPDKAVRDPILAAAQKDVDRIRSSGVTVKDRDRRIVERWKQADRDMKKAHIEKNWDNPSNLLTMHKAKVKPGWDQYKQMVLAPMVITAPSGKDLVTPVTKSYAEGLDVGGYWAQMPGARRGAVMKVQETAEPGALSKLLQSTTMDMIVTGKDCETPRGISMPITNLDVHDRFLARDFKAKDVHVPVGTLLTPTVVSKMRSADKNANILVRSPLKCEHAKGVCQKCMGLAATGQEHDIGENVGVQAAQTLSERAMQLTLRVFHTGGAATTSGGKDALSGFNRFHQLTTLPKKIPNSTSFATRAGTVEKIDTDPTGVNIWIGGKRHHVGKDTSGMALHKPLPGQVAGPNDAPWVPPKVGMKVDRGFTLSDPNRTFVNPHELYKATGSIETVQNHMAKEIHEIYKNEGVRRQHAETLVKAMSNLTKVKNPGDYEGVLRGEFHPTSKISSINRELAKKDKRPIEHEPTLKGVDMLPLSLQDDWMAKLQHQRLTGTILDAASTNGKSSIHGVHPIPGMAFGAEFGLPGTPEVEIKPSLKHLDEVPSYMY
jgi:DNA-directed RNA polymerase subunit beta'